MAKKATKKSVKFLGVDVGLEIKARVQKVSKMQANKSVSQWVREALLEKLDRDERAVTA